MLHLGDALGYSKVKLGTAKEVQLDDRTVVLTDLRDPVRLRFTSLQIATTIRLLATELHRYRQAIAGDGHSDTVVTVFPQSCDSLFAILAVSALSWAAAPLSPDDRLEGYRHNFHVMKPTMALVHEECEEACRAAREAGVPLLTLRWDFSEDKQPRLACSFLSRSDSDVIPDFVPPASFLCPHETDVCIRYRKPGSDLIIPLTHRNLVVSIANVQRCYGFQGVRDIEAVTDESIDVAFCVAPVHQIHGLVATCLSMLSMQAGVIIGDFRPDTFWRTIRECGVTWTSLLPHMVFELMTAAERDQETAVRSSLRFIRVTSLHIDAELAAELERVSGGVPVLCAYSGCIASHQITSNGYPTFENRLPGSVGLPTGCEVCVLNEDNECVSRDVEGFIWIRGHNVIDAYEGEAANSADPENFLLHNLIEWSLARPPSFVSSAFDLGSGRHRFFSDDPASDPPPDQNTSFAISISPAAITAAGESSPQRSAPDFGSESQRDMHSESIDITPQPVSSCSAPLSSGEPTPSNIGSRTTSGAEHGASRTSSSSDSGELIELVAEGGLCQEKRSTDFFEYADPQRCDATSDEEAANSAFHVDLYEKPRHPPLRGKRINRFASGLSAYASDFPLRHDQMLSPLPLIIRWVKTHDRGRIDSEGRLFITQQTAQIIRVGAHAVSTDKVELRLRKIDGVVEAMALGIPDPRIGQKIVAAVQLSKPRRVDDILAELGAKYAEFELPSELIIFQSLPDIQNKVGREKLTRKIYELYQASAY